MNQTKRTRTPSLIGIVAVLCGLVSPVVAGAANSDPLASTAIFDPAAPFTVVGGAEYDTTIEAPEGVEFTDDETQIIIDDLTEEITLPEGVAAATSGTTFTYADLDLKITTSTYVPDDVVNVVKDAFSDWRDNLDLDLPAGTYHTIELRWENLGSSLLAGASTGSVTVNQGSGNVNVPTFLADTLSGTNSTPGSPAITIYVNSSQSWDYSLSPADQFGASDYFLKTIMLHEIGHGLGMTAGLTEATISTATPTLWTSNLYFNKDLTQDFVTQRASVVEQDNMWFQNTDGTFERAFDSSSWNQGTSLSHYRDGSYQHSPPFLYEPGALMTGFAVPGEASIIDGVTVGAYTRMGYSTSLYPAAPTIESYDYNNGTLTVIVSPDETANDFVHVPAESWTLAVADSSSIVDTVTVDATERSLSLSVELSSGNYTVSVTAGTDGNTDSVDVDLNVEGSEVTTTTAPSTTVPEVTTTTAPSTTVPSTTVSEVITTTAPSTTVPSTTVLEVTTTTQAPNIATTVPVIAPPVHYANCAAVRAAGLAPMLSTHESYRSVFDTDGNGIGCETTLIVSPDEPQLDAAAPATWYRFQIARLYSAYFGRFPDSGGWVYWNGRLSDGESLAEFSQFFSESPEFQATYGTGMSNSEFVSLVYVNVLQRDEDPEGYNYWVSQLDSGMTRGRLMIGFSESIEFQFNAGPQVTGSCWTGATSPHQTEAVNASYACYAAETPGTN